MSPITPAGGMYIMENFNLTTESVVEKKRLPYWREVVCETFVELDCESPERNDFFGSIQNSSIGDIQFSDIRSAAQQVRRTRSIISQSDKDYFLLSLQTEGRGVVSQDGRTALLNPGDFALYDATRPYDLRFEDSFGQLVLRLPRPIVTGRLAEAEQLTALPILGDHGVGRLASSFIRQLHAQIDEIDQLSVARLHASAVDLLATALAAQNGTGSARESQILLRRRIDAFIDRHLADPQLNCEFVARAHGISERYLRKIFEGSTMSVSERIWSRRLDQAKRDLADPLHAHISVTGIGYDVGFKDAAHFSRAFKSRFDETPRDFRARTTAARS